MKLPDILRRWPSQSETVAWEDVVFEMEKRQRGKEADLKTFIEAQGWRLDLGAEPFITLAAGLEIKPVGGNRFEKRAPGGQWVRANPVRDFPPGDLVPLQRACNLFIEVVHLQQGARELPAAIEEFKRECQRLLTALRSAKSPLTRDEVLAQLRTFFGQQQEVLPISCRKELLEAEFTTLLDAFRVADSAQESEDLRGQLRDFFRKHRESGTDRWEEIFIREEHQKQYRDRLEGLSRAASPDDIARHKEQLLAFANKYEQYLPGNPMTGIQAAWNRALENNIPPAAPTGLKASIGREEGISLSWNSSLGATQYQAYRSESDAPETRSFLDSVPVPVAVTSANPAFLDSSATAGRDYFYWVTATNPRGESSFAGPVKGSRLQPVAQPTRTLSGRAPPELTARMMKAMEEGDMLSAIEIYTLNLDYAGIWIGMLNEVREVCLENARDAKRSADALMIAVMLANHKTIQKKLRDLIKADGNPARIRALTKISARNNDFVAELDEHLRILNQREAKAEEQRRADEAARAEAEAAAAAQARQFAEAAAKAREEDRLRAEAEAARIADQMRREEEEARAAALAQAAAIADEKRIAEAKRAGEEKRLAEEKVLTEAAAAAAAGKPEAVRILLDQHEPSRERLIPHLHQAIQVQVQARAKEAATPQAVESLKGLLQTYKDALKSQPMLTKALESLVVQTEARVNAETKIKLLEQKILAEARKRAASATTPEDIQLLDHWLDQQMSRLPAHNPTLASELKALVTRAQHTLPKPKRTADPGGKEDWKQEALICGQAKRLADEGDWNGVRDLIAGNPRRAPRLKLFLMEAVQTDVRRQALYTTTKAGLAALQDSIQKHRALLDQDAELSAEFDQLIRQANGAIRTRFKKKVLWLMLILAGLIAAGVAIGLKL